MFIGIGIAITQTILKSAGGVVVDTFRIKANNVDLLVVNGTGDYLRFQ